MAEMGWTPNKENFFRMLSPKAGPARVKPLPGFPCMFLCLCFFLLLVWPTPARSAAARSPAAPPILLKQPASFNDCVRVALRQSPFFTKSSLEIEVRRLDEADSRSDFFPGVNVTTRYYPSQPNNPNVSDPLDYYVAFYTGDYNPLVAYFSLKARKMITQIATLAHLKVISTGLKRLGKAFLQLDSMERLAQLQKSLAEIAQEKLRYARERQKLGEIPPMEVDIASQEEVVAKAEREAVIASQSQIREAIRNFLDLKPDQPLRLDLQQTRHQVLGDFDPARANLEEVRDRDFEVRIKQLTQKLQTYNVTLAKMKFLPNLNFALQTPDPVSSTINRGTFFSVGLSFPIFDGFKRVRDIKRQNTILKQYASEEEVKSKEISQEWREAEEKLKTTGTTLKVAQAQAELAHLKERQAETLYRRGEGDFSLFMAARQARVKAQKEAIGATLEYDLAVLELRYLSGDLVYNYVHEKQFQE
jgi:outer membrane protein TolC